MLTEILKAVLLGVVEGITEWLPVSSTGHMLLVDELMTLGLSQDFKEMFFIVVQLGAIMAVVLLFWKKMIPLDFSDGIKVKKQTVSLWFKVALACVPGAVVTLLLDDFVESYLHTPSVIASALIFYGIAFILVENKSENRALRAERAEDISYKEALLIGLFQVLSIIPGTSRSGATIIGALIIGVSRIAAAEFTFFLAVPVMLGLSFIKLVGFGFTFNATEIAVLAAGSVTAFIISLAVVKGLMNYVKRKNFKAFGYYRIILGMIILIYYSVII